MPKSINYKANSIVYFKGDTTEYIYILKSGKVGLRFNDIETGQEMHDLIQTGEFFSVKSSLGRYPKEETAVVLQDAEIIAFTVPEFEQMAMQNTRIIMKMLKVFSNQLRRIHKQVRNLLSAGESVNPETGLFRIGGYYLKKGRYSQALYAFQRYLTYYPSGQYASEAADNIQTAEKRLQAGGGTTSTASPRGGAPAASGQGLSPLAKQYYNAVSLFSQQKFGEALTEFRKISEDGSDREYLAKSLFEIGRCFFSLGDFDKCIAHYTGMVQQYPKHPDLVEALYYVGSSYEKKGDASKAANFYNKILSMVGEEAPVHRKARRALKALEGV